MRCFKSESAMRHFMRRFKAELATRCAFLFLAVFLRICPKIIATAPLHKLAREFTEGPVWAMSADRHADLLRLANKPGLKVRNQCCDLVKVPGPASPHAL